MKALFIFALIFSLINGGSVGTLLIKGNGQGTTSGGSQGGTL